MGWLQREEMQLSPGIALQLFSANDCDSEAHEDASDLAENKYKHVGDEEVWWVEPGGNQAPTQLLAHPHHPQSDGGENRKNKVRKFVAGDKDRLMGEERGEGNPRRKQGNHMPSTTVRHMPSWSANNGHLGSQYPSFLLLYPSLYC